MKRSWYPKFGAAIGRMKPGLRSPQMKSSKAAGPYVVVADMMRATACEDGME